MKIYLDLVLLLNFAVNWARLRATGLLTGNASAPWRVGLGAGVGAVYAGLCLLPGLSFLAGNLWRVVFLWLMVTAAFGLGWGQLRQGGVFLCLSFALGGLVYCLEMRGFWMLLLAAGALTLGCRIFLRGAMRHAGQLVPVSIYLGGKRVELTALRDSGNSLKDPFTGQNVLIAQADRAAELLPLTKKELEDPAGAMERLQALGHCCRLIPYKALGTEGVLLAVRFDRVTVDGKTAGPLVALAAGALSGADTYQALTGGQYA